MRPLLLAASLLALSSGLAAQPVLDGTINPSEGYTLLGTSAGGPSSSFGTADQLNAIYAAVDAADLYVAVAGNVTFNRTLIFIDSNEGGASGGDYNRGRTGGGDLPNATRFFDAGHTFDPGFTADYALEINQGGGNYYFDLIELRGTFDGGETSSVCYLGSAQVGTPGARVAANPTSTPTNYTNGFEVRLSRTSTTACDFGAVETAISDRTSVSFFALVTNNDGNGFLSNHFLSPAPASQTDHYGEAPQDFGAASHTQDPLSFVWQTTTHNPTSAAGDGAGWRHLASPVVGLDVYDLAQINHVQGVPAGTTNPSPFPNGTDVVYVTYNPDDAEALGNGFVPPATTDHTFGAGRGLMWYWFDNTFGTTRSVELTDFVLRAGGKTERASVTGVSFPDYATAEPTRFFLVGNPFALPLDVAGITSVPARQTVMQVYNPATNGYSVCLESPADAGECARTHLDVWQGAFAEVSADASEGTTFAFDVAATTDVPASDPGFVGKTATPAVALRLTGATEAGSLTDGAALVRFDATASDGWDLRDASKLTPPGGAYALLAPVLDRGGALTRTAVTTLALDREAAAIIPVAFRTTHAGAFEIAWDGVASLPEGWRAELRDLATGTLTDLVEGGTYAFDATATAWTDRFVLSVGPANVVAGEGAPAEAFALAAPRPNPTAGTARAALTTGEATYVRASVVDALGRIVRTAYDGAVAPGTLLDLAVETRGLAPGAYVLRVEAAGRVLTQAITVVR